jgi:GNAT superfamily N-acetyltransferase
MATLEHERTMALQIELALRPATRAVLPGLEWFGLYTHFRRLFERTYEEQTEGRRLMLVADLNGFPVGQIFVHFTDAGQEPHLRKLRGYLYALRVLEPLQGRGIGTRLIQEAERELLARGYRWSVIAVAKDNPGARRLYERLSYVVFADDPGIWHYTDHEGRACRVEEPAWMLQKALTRTLLDRDLPGSGKG